MPRVLIADQLSPAAEAIFKERGLEADTRVGLTKDELLAVIGGYDGLAVRSATKVTAEVLAAAGRLKVVGRAGIGVDNIDVEAATQRGVVVMNTPFGNSVTTAEHAISLMLALARQIPAADRSTRAGRWEKNRFMGMELMGKMLGLVGCGNIGSIVADRAHGLKMRVIAYDPFLSPERARDLGVEKVDLDALLARADVISLHTPLTEQTRNLLCRANLEQDQARRAARQLRARRAGRRAGGGRPDPRPATSPVPPSTCSRSSPPASRRCSGSTRWSSRRIWAPPPARRRRTWRCRWPSRSATI